MDHQRAHGTSPGLIAGLASMAKNMFGLLVSRVELAALELSQVRGHVLQLLLIGALGIVALWFAVAFWTVLIVFLAWDAWGWKILLLIAAVFTVLAVGMFLYVQAMLRQGKLSLPTTMAELRNDRDALL